MHAITWLERVVSTMICMETVGCEVLDVTAPCDEYIMSEIMQSTQELWWCNFRGT